MTVQIDRFLDDLTTAASSVRSIYADLFDPVVPTVPIPLGRRVSWPELAGVHAATDAASPPDAIRLQSCGPTSSVVQHLGRGARAHRCFIRVWLGSACRRLPMGHQTDVDPSRAESLHGPRRGQFAVVRPRSSACREGAAGPTGRRREQARLSQRVYSRCEIRSSSTRRRSEETGHSVRLNACAPC